METSGDEGIAPNEQMGNIDPNEKPMNHDEEYFDDGPDFDNNDNDEHRFQVANRGGFRGRWNAGAISPRFRGRGFAPNQMGNQPVRRGGPQFFRGNRPPNPRFPNNSGFDPNWNPPMYAPPHMPFNNQQVELWVETKTDDGKSYYYHAITRETTWTRPEGQFVKIMGQGEVESMQAAKNQQATQQQQPQQQQPAQQPMQVDNAPPLSQNSSNNENSSLGDVSEDTNFFRRSQNSDEGAQLNGDNQSDANGQIGGAPQKKREGGETPLDPSKKTNENVMNEQANAPHQSPQMNQQPPPQQQNTKPPMQVPQTQQPPPMMSMPMQNQPPQMQPQFNTPPPFNAQFPIGMPPPNYMYPPNPWSMPWQQQVPPIGPDGKPIMPKPGMIDPQIMAKAAEWSEHRAPDGRAYYYHAMRGESVWEKPQALKDLEAAQASMQPFPMMPPMMTGPPHTQPIVPGTGAHFDAMNFNAKPDVKPEESEEAKLEKKKKQEAERKKKEEEEKAKQVVAKQQDKSRPISSTPIAGTPWCVVWTGDGRVFYYNPSTRTSVWERPEDLVGRADVDKAVSTTPEQLQTQSSNANSASTTPAATKTDDKAKPAESNAEATAATTKRSESDSSGENDDVPNKKPKLAENTVTNTTNSTKPTTEKKNDIGKEAAIEAEVRAARERALVPLETRVNSFKEMLKEKDVSAFSTWEKELHKIVFDPRYLLLTSRERKQVFEKYVKERAEEERREKRNKMRQKRDDFRSLMESVNLHGKSSFSDFAQKYGKEERFKGIEKMRDRESLFNEYILEVRRREKDEKIQKKETIRKEFIALLRECSEIKRHSRWGDVKKRVDNDSRYRAVESSLLREDYFHDYLKMLKDERRKQKDKEREHKDKKEKDKHRDKDRQRDKGKDGKSKDKRDKRADSKDSDKQNTSKDEKSSRKDSDKEDHEDGEHPETSEDEERQQRDRDRQLRAEQSIKEREKEVQQQLAGHLRDLHKERAHHKRDEAMRHFSALLADLVRNPDLTWKEVKKQLRKDSRWESVEQLDRDDRERIFNDHIIQLGNKKRDKFREMLNELPKFELTASWKDIKRQIRDDPRYLKYNSSDKCEREFREYIRDKTTEAKCAFKELLQECKLITYKSFETVKENALHLKEIEDILKNDKRFLTLDHIQYDRSQILMNYLKDLKERGPPPPPTASESTRRK